MGFIEHLEELRKRIIRSIASIVADSASARSGMRGFSAGCRSQLFRFSAATSCSTQLVYTNPIDPFNMYLKISLIAGIFVASPFMLYQVWGFIAPGLYKSERRYVGPFMISTVGLFVAGGFLPTRWCIRSH